MKKKLFKYLIITLSAISVLSFTACGKKPTNTNTSNTETSASVQEETDPFAVEFDIQAERESNASEGRGSNTDTNGAGTNNEVVQETEDTRTAAEIEESMAQEEYESMVSEDEAYYEEYLNSDEENEIRLIYKKTENNIMYFTEDVPEDAGYEARTYTIDKSIVTGTIDELNPNDVANISFNGAINREQELVKVYGIKNQTRIDEEEERADAEEEAAEEAELAKREAAGEEFDPIDIEEIPEEDRP